MARRKLKPKQEATVERMKETRVNDSINLRELIKSKLSWAIEERKKGLDVITKQIAQIKENQNTILKLDGIITAFTELLEPEEKEAPKVEEPKKE